MENGGGRVLRGKLDELFMEVLNYYGLLNALSMGTSKTVPEKPEILAYYDQIRELNTLLLAGGLLDQPYIFMQEISVVIRAKKHFNAIQKAQQSD